MRLSVEEVRGGPVRIAHRFGVSSSLLPVVLGGGLLGRDGETVILLQSTWMLMSFLLLLEAGCWEGMSGLDWNKEPNK